MAKFMKTIYERISEISSNIDKRYEGKIKLTDRIITAGNAKYALAIDPVSSFVCVTMNKEEGRQEYNNLDELYSKLDKLYTKL